MIYLEMYGRLGNQFFRYAVARAMQLELYPGEKVVINFQQIDDLKKNDPSFYNVLEDFNVADYGIYQKGGKVIFKESSLCQKIVCALYYLQLRKYAPEQMNKLVEFESKWQALLNKFGLYWFRRGSWELQKSNKENKFLSGNFEDPRYFDGIRDMLISELTPKYPVIPKNEKMLNMIRSTNSICLSVRRGDFESNADFKKLHSICHREYFEQAIDKIKHLVPNPTFFMFSDDIEWVRKNIVTGCETFYEDGTDPVWEKLRLMSTCKHFIISNSTFSWWVQYLSTYENKIVVSPSKWFNNDYDSPLIDKNNWILIEA